MKPGSALLILVLASSVVLAQDHSSHLPAKPMALMPGLGDLHHPVSTSNPQAQQFFDQGLRLIYAFNHDEAERSFAHAAELDSKLAMAYWGVAEAVGPNYNDPASDDRFTKAHEVIQKAVELSANASPSEQAYIQAMAKRFPPPGADRRKAAEDYHDAMREVARRFPDDLDAATLFAESAMNLHPWGLWHTDGTPEAGTEEIVATLESVVRRDPNHLGAVHYYIHAVEASPNPERALAGANRLASLAPAAGHIVHMPAHIYIRTGDYDAAVNTNEQAAAADRAYIKASGVQGIYPMMYYSHNLHFIAIAGAMEGNYKQASEAAKMLADHVQPHVKEVPPLEAFMIVPLAVELRFARWNEVLNIPQPTADMKVASTFWHYARGMALASTGKLTEAQAEYKTVAESEAATPPDAIFSMPFNNHTKDILQIAKNVLGAKIAVANKEYKAAIPVLQEAVAVQDRLNYGEPPDWYFPVREALGATLLMNGDAAGAEQVFRADLERNPRNPRSLFGLKQVLRAQGKDYDASFVEKEFSAAWKGGSNQLRVEDLV